MRFRVAAIAAACSCVVAAVGCGSPAPEEQPATARAPQGFFGVVPQIGLSDEDVDRMAQGKIGLIRLVIPWGQVDPTGKRKDLDFGNVDPIVLAAASEGIRVLPTIYGSPEWAARDLDGADCGDAVSCAAFAPRSDAALAAWKRFIDEMASRYGPDGKLWADHPAVDPVPIRTWQVWNEQNSPTFYQPKVDPAAYERLVATTAEAIHARDPGGEVILGGMFGTPPPGEPAWDFLRQLYAIDGARDYFDGVSVHPYAAHEHKLEFQVERLGREIRRAGDDAHLWVTEVGASSDEGDDPLERGPEGQAQTLRAAFDFFLANRRRLDIEGVTWYSWRDVPGDAPCAWCPRSGLFEYEHLTPKPAWDAYMSFTGGS